MGKRFDRMRQFYAASPPQTPLSHSDSVALAYRLLRIRALESTFLGYASFYFVRNNLSVVTVDMQHALGYSKEMVGNILAMTALTYGLSKFLMGSVSDRSNSRRFMATMRMARPSGSPKARRARATTSTARARTSRAARVSSRRRGTMRRSSR